MAEPSLGLVMILRDEAANLPRSLAPVAACFDEVVALDTGSQDGTPELAASLGAKVHHFAWVDDFAAARNRSLELARADWLLWLDGDNALTPAEVGLLRAAIPAGPAILWARERVEPSGETLWQKRCFPRHPQARFQGRVHEQLVHPAHWPQIPTSVVISHWGYADPERKKSKAAYYLDLLEQSLAADANDFYSRWQAGRCLSDQRRFAQAADYFARVARDPAAREINPEIWRQSHLQWARSLERLGRAEEARSILEHLLQLEPGHGLAHLARGRLAYQLGDWAGAAAHLARALELGLGLPFLDLDPEREAFQAAFYLGRALERLGRRGEAAKALAQACDIMPQNPAARSELARLLWELGQRDLARANIEQILDANPAHRQARLLLAQWEEAA